MSYPFGASRAVRRAYSRDESRELAFLGTRGQREGGWPAEIVWKKHVPVVPTRSGQARVNHKRNRRLEEFHEHQKTQGLIATVRSGLMSADEARAELGFSPWGVE